MTKLILPILFSLFSTYAQKAPSIRTGRPGQSIGPHVVGTNVFQLQSGVEYNRTKTTSETEAWINNNVFRYGIDEKYELSGVIDLKSQDPSRSGFDNVQVGGRVNLIDGADVSDSWIPALCFQARVRLQGNGDFKRNKTAPVFVIAAVENLGDLGSLTANYILSYDGFSTKANHAYTLAWGFPLNEKWGTFIEEYASYSPTSDQWTHAIDTGFSYLVHSNLQYDVAFGIDLESDFTQEYIALGLSWRTF